MLSTVRFHEVAQKRGPRALEIAREIAEHDEPDIVRLTAAKFLIERGYGRDDCGIDVTQAKEVRVFLGTREEREQLREPKQDDMA